MSGLDDQRAILNSDIYWGTGTAASRDSCGFNAIDRASLAGEEPIRSNRHIHTWTDGDGKFQVVIDPVEGCLRGVVETVASKTDEL